MTGVVRKPSLGGSRAGWPTYAAECVVWLESHRSDRSARGASERERRLCEVIRSERGVRIESGESNERDLRTEAEKTEKNIPTTIYDPSTTALHTLRLGEGTEPLSRGIP